jgi:hypothetical protein
MTADEQGPAVPELAAVTRGIGPPRFARPARFVQDPHPCDPLSSGTRHGVTISNAAHPQTVRTRRKQRPGQEPHAAAATPWCAAKCQTHRESRPHWNVKTSGCAARDLNSEPAG